MSTLFRLSLGFFLFLLLGSFLPPALYAKTAWFVSGPTGVRLSGAQGEAPRLPEGAWPLWMELEYRVHGGDLPLPIDFERHQLIGRSGPYRLQVGQQTLSEQNLILRDFRRRGFSLQTRGGPADASLTGFLLRADRSAPEGGEWGIEDENNRIAGAVGGLAPEWTGPVRMRVSAGVLSGRRPGRFSGEIQQGDAWTAAAEAALWERLQLRGEIAGTRSGTAELRHDADEGRATSVSARYRSTVRLEDAAPIDWSMGVENLAVGPGFHSLGNPSLPSDRSRLRLFGGVSQERLQLSAEVARERSQGGGHRLPVAAERHDASLQLRYEVDRPLPPLLGTPRYTLLLDGFRRRPLHSETGGRTADDEQMKMQYRVDFSRERFNWGAGYLISTYRDWNDDPNNSFQRSVELRVDARLFPRFSLLTTAELGTTFTEAEEMDLVKLGLKGELILLPDRLTGGWDMSMAQNDLVSGGRDISTVLAGNLTWTVRQPEKGQAGFDLALSASRRERENTDRPWLDRMDYLLYLSLTMTLPS